MAKLKAAVFKFTSCSGCQLEILRLEDKLLDVAELLDFEYWVMVKTPEREHHGPYDVSFVEGTVSTPKEIEEIKRVRAASKVLVALGDCAVAGCVNAIRNWMAQREAERISFPNPLAITSIKVYGIDEYVPVDIYLRGCPPHRETFLEVVKALALDINPRLRRHPVCVECKLSGNECLLTVYRQPCMGPVTNAGCGALCPTLYRVCEGCYGPMSNSNVEGLVKAFGDLGLSDEDIIRKFRKYASMTSEFREVAKL